ncbi:cyclic pyranopterin monophosphate synthase MoaC [Aliifodinibius sp. S!AR15-10]|uniref:cyclic pyranopterin monophosphate synthase MoaC n=1 Tax=Aliifodinibius sp. S!AR15-10 TaxID=2950437 RepID=UPI00285BA163|nr:cyclic pyranopterin monophosphate synthase MoaC [Aliifodinibius sp. S!AR15-10]MDR8389672.1 cyclic pyranopterin monophosphate synthase MoaC [Aliifodinibius sp. S!AR15-10]
MGNQNDKASKSELSHISESGDAEMVDVSGKQVTSRKATASGKVVLPRAVFDEITTNDLVSKKGSIVQTAVIAGIQAAKKTSELIPLCHQLPISKIDIDIKPVEPELHIRCTVKCSAQTGVEMEALTGVSTAALTIYDMCKAMSHDIRITDIQLEHKSGGKTDFSR